MLKTIELPWQTSIFRVGNCVEKVDTFPQAVPEKRVPDVFHKNIPTLNTVMLGTMGPGRDIFF
jgi:hypothetical protein